MAISFVMMALGEYRFGLTTAAFQSLERTRTWRWQAVERVGALPVQQYIGPGEDTVKMDGVIYPHFRGGIGQVDRMAAQANRGEPLLLVDGEGGVWGRFVITEATETRTLFFSNGQPRKVEFSLSLTNYGGDVQ